jgi:hypothetical protein
VYLVATAAGRSYDVSSAKTTNVEDHEQAIDGGAINFQDIQPVNVGMVEYQVLISCYLPVVTAAQTRHCLESPISFHSRSSSHQAELLLKLHNALPHQNLGSHHLKMFKCLYICISEENSAGRQLIHAGF